MPNIYIDVDIALSEVPINILSLIDDTDFKTREVAITYDQAGMDLVWNFVTTGGVYTQTAVTPTTGGDYDWTHQGDGMYSIEIPASGGASINNDAEGFGWFTGYCTGVLPWRSPIIGFRAVALNNALIDGGDELNVNVTKVNDTSQTANDNGADINTILSRIIGTLATGTHEPQTGDGYAIVNNGTYGNSAIEALVDELETRLTAVRAGYLDELNSINIPTDIDTLLTRLSSARAGYLDNLSAGAVALNSNITTLLSRIVGTLAVGTHVAQTGDSFARIGGAGAGLTSVGLTNDAITAAKLAADAIAEIQSGLSTVTEAQVNAQCDTAIVDASLSTAANLAIVDVIVDALLVIANKLDTALELDGAVYRYTTNALEQAPSGTGGDATEAKQDTIIASLVDAKGATFVTGDDSLEAISDKVSAITITGAFTVTISVVDQDDNAVPDVSIQIWNSTLTTLLTYGTSNSLGQITPSMDAGSYKVKLKKAGYSFTDPESLAVSANMDQEYTGNTLFFLAPSGSTLTTRVYEYCYSGGDPVDSVEAFASITSMPEDSGSAIYASKDMKGVYNKQHGVVYWDIIKGATVRFKIIDFGINVSKIVPTDADVARLTDIE